MLDRKLLVEALRVDNKDVLPKFGSSELRKMMEAATEYISIDSIMDYEEGKVTDDGIYSIMDSLDRGSVGIADSDGQPALNFMKNGTEIYAHNMFTDEDEVLDATAVALSEYIVDQLETQTFDTNEAATEDATNVIFKREPNEYTNEVDILAVFPDDIEQAGDEGRVSVYSHVGQHSYASPFYIEELEDATPEEYEDLKQELEGQGYQLNVLNGLDQDLPEEAEVPEVNSTLSEDITGNYGLAIAKDTEDGVKVLEIEEGYNSMEEVQDDINDIETDYEFQDDPEMMVFAVYCDGVSWFNAVTGEEVDYEKDESVNEEDTEQELYSKINNKYGEDVWVQLVQDSNVFNLANEQEEVDFINKWSGKVDRDLLDQFIQYAIQGAFESVSEDASVVPKQKSRKNEVSDELKNKVAARRQIDAEIANDAENEILVKHGRKSKEYKKAHAKTNAAIDKLNKFGRSSHDIIKSKEYQAMDDGKYAAPGVVRKNEDKRGLRTLSKFASKNLYHVSFGNSGKFCKDKFEAKAVIESIRSGKFEDMLGRSIAPDVDIRVTKDGKDVKLESADSKDYMVVAYSKGKKVKEAKAKDLADAKVKMSNYHIRFDKVEIKENGKVIKSTVESASGDKTYKVGQLVGDRLTKDYVTIFKIVKPDEEYAVEYPNGSRSILTKEELDSFNESAQKSEALSLDELLNMYKEEIDEAKARLDKCYERVAYRLKENVSYSPEQATPIIANLATDVRTKSSDVVDEVYRKLG